MICRLEGYTLAAALLFGTPQTLLTTVPQHFMDALLRRVDEDRYEDRDYSATTCSIRKTGSSTSL
ncbi:hypothetical protein HNV11_02745 [Spirosoma taeanense]|uniref:Uncharacterized protein n=1 Tax=Spirosoma taeanense TaxID=2735870 RepID=A0A6M5Y0R5_9BACT|nr:hypothetical protein [Spirosoma taeanense]QJW88368.1 hypothetical protein HNV11_02745 [Spirosoma taeanense]